MMMRRIVLIMLGVLAVGLPAQAQDFFGDGWQAQYYDNSSLSGSPVLTRSEPRLDLNFGAGSPGQGVPNDNFSAVFTTNENFQDNTEYEFVAVVDDGVRVTVGGQTVIDQFNSPPGTYSGRLRISGSQQIRVEYRETTGSASIQFYWRIAGPAPPPQLPPGAIGATVIRTSALVVRDGPSLGANRLGTIRRGEIYQVIGRDADARWFLLDLGGQQGWAWGYYLFIDGNEFNPPVVGPFALSAGLEGVPLIVRSVSGLKLRAQPNVQSAQIGRIGWGDTLPVIGRSERGSWYLVVWKGTEGWVFSPFTEEVQGNLNDVPFVPGSGALVQTGPAAAPPYDTSGGGDVPVTEPTPAGPTAIPEEAPPDFSS